MFIIRNKVRIVNSESEKKFIFVDFSAVIDYTNSMKNNTKTREPQQNRSVSTKEKIINAGIELFSEKGYYHTNSKEIVEYAGVGVGSFYDYFKDKKDLLMTIMVHHRNAVAQSLDTMQKNLVFDKSESLTKAQKKNILSGFINYVLDFHESSSKFHSQIPKLRFMDKDIADIIEEWDKNQIKVIYNILKNPQLNIKPTDIQTAATLIHRTTEDIAHYIMGCENQDEKARLHKELIDMLDGYLFA